MTDMKLHGIEDGDMDELEVLRETLIGNNGFYRGGIDDPVVQFQIVIDRIARLESQINKIDDTITKTKEFIEKISDTVGPIIEKLSNNVFLKGFIS